MCPNLDWSLLNSYRLVRALEVVTATGKPMSEYGGIVTKTTGDFDYRCFGLVLPRLRLYRSIDQRCERMLMHGLLSVCIGAD
jgi:tRNA dimethylallyltransferase